MRAKWGVALVGCLVLVGCGSGDDSASQTPEQTTQQVSPEGPFFGLCGSVTDDEVRAEFGLPAFTMITRNSVGCEWDVSGYTGPSVSFSWYRGSPIGRERAGTEMIGRSAEDIEIDGHPGFAAATENYLCEVGVQFDDDFVHWSVMYSDTPPTADPCVVAKNLAALTVKRAR